MSSTDWQSRLIFITGGLGAAAAIYWAGYTSGSEFPGPTAQTGLSCSQLAYADCVHGLDIFLKDNIPICSDQLTRCCCLSRCCEKEKRQHQISRKSGFRALQIQPRSRCQIQFHAFISRARMHYALHASMTYVVPKRHHTHSHSTHYHRCFLPDVHYSLSRGGRGTFGGKTTG
jgi:hypothetical protein